MSNSKQEVLTQPQKLELEEYLRYLVIGGQLSWDLYEQVLDGIAFRNLGTYISFEGIYGTEVRVRIDEADAEKLEKIKNS